MHKRELARLRLRAQRLTGPPLEAAEEVVGWLGAVQSQDYQYARWSLGKRTRGLTEPGVDRLLAEGRILRTHILRPTWHFVRPDDVGWIMGLTGPRVAAKTRLRMAQLGLDDRLLSCALEAIARALDGGNRLTRRELGDALVGVGIDADAGRLAYILMHAELELVVVSGGLAGTQQTYGLLFELCGPPRQLPRDEALAELTLRYFRSHGPASIPDFTWWSSLTGTDAKRGLAMVGRELDRIDVEGIAYWLDASLERGAAGDGATAARGPHVHLLQAFDEYVVGYQRTRSAMDADGLAGPGTWNPNTFIHAVIVDGQIVGGWRRRAENGGLVVETRLLRELTRSERAALVEAVERYGMFAGLPARLA
jgi:hypothetical protein